MTKFSAAQQSQLAQIGAFLKENREKQSKSLQDIAVCTYIRPQLLSGIETGNPDMLPEPIFVQGFIRRYAETLGLKGLELAQQFTVTSIPSTPRPAKTSAPESSSTTRLTRTTSPVNKPATGAAPAAEGAPMFSAGSKAPLEESLVSNTPRPVPTELPAELPAEPPMVVDDAVIAPAVSESAASESVASESITSESITSESITSDPAASDPDTIAQTSELPSTLPTPDISQDSDIPVAPALTTSEDTVSMPLVNTEEDFASKISAFDQQNLVASQSVPSSVDMPSIQSSTAESSTAETSTTAIPQITTPNFDDDLPAAFTTKSTANQSSTPSPYSSARPVGVDIGSTDTPNLKPFAIGAVVVAALTAGILLIANMLGGGEPAPDVAETPEPTEQTTETLPTVPDEVPPTPEPPASTAPVYVEAEATAETYVSVRTDGVTVFEDIMQPGDTLLWEAQEVIDVYSGNAGGLEVSVNGEPGEVLGEDGQLGQQVFTAE
ncbi:MAG: RodZ domain-containing protein [Cyanobacteria bacterium J06643_4]